MDRLTHSVLYIGDERSGARALLQERALQMASEGLRVQVFDTDDHWLPGEGQTAMDRRYPPFMREPLTPAGRIQSWIVPVHTDAQSAAAVLASLDPNDPAPGPDVLVFSRSVPIFNALTGITLSQWVERWEERRTITLHYATPRDLQMDGYLIRQLLYGVHEVLVFGQEPDDLVRSWMEYEGIPERDVRELQPGEYIRFEDVWSYPRPRRSAQNDDMGETVSTKDMT
ncbi:hypothetical protein NR402_12620 [Acidithiobacillus ferrooxidans]|uniref:hypothetical protein n=1 Tax=Acidithiobacillus ferrooxidans TaxID=920 RepID=UPI00214C4BE6|nr:hypothetical protein [Acidithiobacillus ferrooxidans]MCR2831119.1 hypothetical protein [Acidithiobacillus ferrooxidans]